ncbi:hypothetical protein M3Y99_00025200 [Aphelenchoides fujianensis]|nr:hypothetical protein M3Y99_00025200 [Aphelenchoides fujianensis]
MDSLDVVEEIADYEQDTMFSHEHGPVRHSLLNLVCQEDIPELLQAMAEDLHFVFDDYLSTRPPMNGIMMSSAKRRSSSQKRQRDNNRICFASESPKVFTYLDETSALSEEKWMDGRLIEYQEYVNMQATATDQAARQALELNKWRAVMQMKYEREDAINSATSQFSQTSLQPPQTSPSSSRTPTPDEIDRSPTTTPRFLYTALTSQRPTLPSMTRQEVGTSAI